MSPVAHVIASGAISVFVWWHLKSAACAVTSFAAGVLIDLDHLIDYYANFRFTLSIRKIYLRCLGMRLKRLYVLLHSYELVIALWAAIYAFRLSDIWKGIAIGFTQHLLFDQITNPLNTFGYFLTYRIVKGFRKEHILHKDVLMYGRKGARRCRR